jgi:hypothetical protein
MNTATLTSAGGVSYTWTAAGHPPTVNSTGIYVDSPTVTTTYSVIGVSAEGCFNSGNMTVQVSECTGTRPLFNETECFVYPNPTIGDFYVKATENTRVTIINSLGQTIYSDVLNGGITKISLDERWTKGVYFVLLTLSRGVQVVKIVKQ